MAGLINSSAMSSLIHKGILKTEALTKVSFFMSSLFFFCVFLMQFVSNFQQKGWGFGYLWGYSDDLSVKIIISQFKVMLFVL